MDKFEIDEIPFQSLAMLGMSKERVFNLDKSNFLRLLSGQRTDIMRFDFLSKGRRFIIDGKLLLERNADGVSASVVPVRKQIQNDYDLNNAELIKLYSGKLINKHIDGQRYILQLDRETNEVLKARTDNIKLPFDIEAKEREKLLSGKNIQVETETGKHTIRLDLLNDKRFAIDGEQQRIRYAGAYFTESDIRKEDRNKYNLKETDIKGLLDGYKTGLIQMQDGSKAKIALHRHEDKTVSIQLFPVKNELNNDLHLNPQQIEKLQKGETVAAKVNGKMYLLQLDKETNDLLRRQMAHVVPDVIRGVQLKQADKDCLINGQSLSLVNKETGETVTTRIDLNHIQGIALSDDRNILKALYTAGNQANEALEKHIPNRLEREKFLSRNSLDKNDLSNTARAAFDERQKFYFDYHNPGVMSYIRTDLNRAEFMAFCSYQSPSLKLKT